MKPLSLLLLCIFVCLASSAQRQVPNSPDQFNNSIVYRNNKAIRKSTSVEPRIIALINYQNGQLYDSAHYYYSQNRRSYFNTAADNLNLTGVPTYPEATAGIQVDSYVYKHTNLTSQYPSNNTVVLYDANNFANTVEIRNDNYWAKYVGHFNGDVLDYVDNYDTINSHNKSFILKSRNIKSYDANGKLIIDSCYNIATGAPISKTTYYYSASLDSSIMQYWSAPSSLQTYRKHIYQYDEHLNDTTIYIYALGYSNSIMSLESIQHLAYNYYNYRINGYLYNFYNSGTGQFTSTPQIIEKDTFAYYLSSPNQIFEGYMRFDTISQSWKYYWYYTFNLNSDANWSGFNYYSFGNSNTLQYFYESKISYGNTGLVDSINRTIYRNNPPTTKVDTSYFRSLYFYDDTGSQAHNGDFDVAIYPNPSTGIFNISWHGNQTNIIMGITNIIGQSINTSTLVSNNTTLNLTPYSAGTYIVSFFDSNGLLLRRQKVTRY